MKRKTWVHNYSSFLNTIYILLLALLLHGCGIEVPPEKQDYIGEWKFDSDTLQISLMIAADGWVEYRRSYKEENVKEEFSSETIEVSGKIKEFKGDDFVIRVLLIKTTFKVDKPPHRDTLNWKMTVDGVELTKK